MDGALAPARREIRVDPSSKVVGPAREGREIQDRCARAPLLGSQASTNADASLLILFFAHLFILSFVHFIISYYIDEILARF